MSAFDRFLSKLIDPLGLFDDDGGGGSSFGKTFDKPEELMPKVPDISDATANIRTRLQEQSDVRRRRRGRAATVLTGSEGAGLPSTARKALLGE